MFKVWFLGRRILLIGPATGRIAKTRKRASHTRNDRDQRIIEGKAALKALIEKKHYLLKAVSHS
jgi:hypothetical protein